MKKSLLFLLCALLPTFAMADVDAEKKDLVLNVRRIGLEWSKTQVHNSADYQDSPVSALKADSQDFIKGVFDTALEYNKNRFQWGRQHHVNHPLTGRGHRIFRNVSRNASPPHFSLLSAHLSASLPALRVRPCFRGNATILTVVINLCVNLPGLRSLESW